MASKGFAAITSTVEKLAMAALGEGAVAVVVHGR